MEQQRNSAITVMCVRSSAVNSDSDGTGNLQEKFHLRMKVILREKKPTFRTATEKKYWNMKRNPRNMNRKLHSSAVHSEVEHCNILLLLSTNMKQLHTLLMTKAMKPLSANARCVKQP